MKRTASRQAYLRLAAVILLLLGTLSANAQYFMNVRQTDGTVSRYAVNRVDSVWFEDQSVPSGSTGTYEYVDLGLSVLWATCNVGATKPEEYGDYFAWGETESKNDYDYYDWSTYKWCNGYSESLTKYNTDSYYGTVDDNTTLDPEDDVAHVKWGGNWRMPTRTELKELRTNCTWTPFWSNNTEFNGVAGYKVTSKIKGFEGCSIFLPATDYWSSSLDSLWPTDAFTFSCITEFDGGDSYTPELDEYDSYVADGLPRNSVLNVRSVCPSDEWFSLITISTLPDNKTLLVDGRAMLNAIINRDGQEIQYPVVWSSDNPSVAVVDENGVVTGISVGTAHISASIQSLTTQCSVTVVETSDIEPEYVDLGLSVKWATFNVGALSPEDLGSYYAWGETEDIIKEDTYYGYKWEDNGGLSKYNTVDNKTTIDPEDDVAHVKWGGSWRMPTQNEIYELIEYCEWTRAMENGVKGYLVTSQKTGYTDCSIFLPATGYCDLSARLGGAGEHGYYWSSSLSTSDAYYGRFLYFNSYSSSTWYDFYRYNGLSVRPVCP